MGEVEPLRPLLSPKQVAAYLAISERKARELLAQGAIASYKVGGQRRIRPEDLEAYLERCRD